jgi:hypothetical protein
MLDSLYFFLFACGCLLFAYCRMIASRWREQRRNRWLAALGRELDGRPMEDTFAQLGPPCEMFHGRGRTMYEWKSPPAGNFPKGRGLLIVYVIADGNDRVTEVASHIRGL